MGLRKSVGLCEQWCRLGSPSVRGRSTTPAVGSGHRRRRWRVPSASDWERLSVGVGCVERGFLFFFSFFFFFFKNFEMCYMLIIRCDRS